MRVVVALGYLSKLILVFSPFRGDPDRERGVFSDELKICFVLELDGLFIFGLTQKRSKKVKATLKRS